MRRLHDRYDRITKSLHLCNVFVWLRLKRDGNVALFSRERGQRFTTSGNLDLVGDPRIIAPERLNRAIQKARNGGLDTEYFHKTTAQLLQIIDLRLQTVEVPHRCARLPREHLAGGGQAYAGRMSLEQRRAEFLFEQRDLAANRRWGDVQHLGRTTNR